MSEWPALKASTAVRGTAQDHEYRRNSLPCDRPCGTFRASACSPGLFDLFQAWPTPRFTPPMTNLLSRCANFAREDQRRPEIGRGARGAGKKKKKSNSKKKMAGPSKSVKDWRSKRLDGRWRVRFNFAVRRLVEPWVDSGQINGGTYSYEAAGGH